MRLPFIVTGGGTLVCATADSTLGYQCGSHLNKVVFVHCNILACSGLRNGPKRVAKWPVLGSEMGHFALRFGPFRKAIQ